MVSKRACACQTPISKDRAELPNHARTLAVSGGPSFIAMVQVTHLRYRHDRPDVGWLHRAWLRRVFVPRWVRSELVIRNEETDTHVSLQPLPNNTPLGAQEHSACEPACFSLR